MPQVQYPEHYTLQHTVHKHTRRSTHMAYLEKQSNFLKYKHQTHTYVFKNVSIVSDLVMSSASSRLKLFEGGVDALLDVRVGHQQHGHFISAQQHNLLTDS